MTNVPVPRRLMVPLILFAGGAGAAGAATPILDLATERAVAYEDAALRWTCDEMIRRVRYRTSGSSTESRATDYSIVLVPDPLQQHAVEEIAPAETRGRPLSRAPSALRGFPPLSSWLRLFHPETRPWMLVRDSGQARSDPPEHAFTFRGAGSIGSGDDVREWEGTAWVNPVTGDLLRIAAVPTVQGERLAKLIERRNIWGIPIDLFGLRFDIGPKAHGRHAVITFGPEGSFWLPSTARLEEFDAVSTHEERPLRATVVSMERCRELEAKTTPEPSEGKGQRPPR